MEGAVLGHRSEPTSFGGTTMRTHLWSPWSSFDKENKAA